MSDPAIAGLAELSAAGGWADRRWLIAGAGASRADLAAARQQGFAICGFDMADPACDLVVAVDVQAVLALAPALAGGRAVLALPWRPHQGGWVGSDDLASLCRQIGLLGELAAERRLCAYPLWTGLGPGNAQPSIRPDFAGEALPLLLLAELGVGFIRHAGMRPASPVAGLEAAHRPGERNQGALAEIRRRFGLSYGPFGYPTPARVFVGGDDEQALGVRVLDYSIQKWSSMDVVVELLDWRAMPVPREEKNRSRTGFSFCRYDIPRLTGRAGRALYVDADMQVFQDITDLWTLPLDEADVLYALSAPSQGRVAQTSVMLLNCEALDWDVGRIVAGLDDGAYSYRALMSELCIVPPERVRPAIPHWWNSLELHEPGRTCLIHYTDMHRQPWVSDRNPNGWLWYRDCAEAIAAGVIDPAELQAAVAAGHVSPRLPRWLGREDLGGEAGVGHWVAPYHRFLSPKQPEGEVFLLEDGALSGWAWDPSAPNSPVELAVEIDGRSREPIVCDLYCEPLERHGKGDGRHGFHLDLAAEADGCRDISLRFAASGLPLKGSPISVPAMGATRPEPAAVKQRATQ